MFNITRLETRFQEIVFLLTVMLALSIAVGGVFYLYLSTENFLMVTGQTGGFLISNGFKYFGYTYFLFSIFVMHIGHLILGNAHLLGDMIRLRWLFVRSAIIYFSILILISSFLTVLESYKPALDGHSLIFGDGGRFGVIVGGMLFRNFGLVGALVILFSILSVIGIAAGFMEIVHSFYVMKDIFSEIIKKVSISGPQKIRDLGQQLVDFVDQPAARVATVSASLRQRSFPLTQLDRKGRLSTDHFHIYRRENVALSQEPNQLERPGIFESETLHRPDIPAPMPSERTQPEQFLAKLAEENITTTKNQQKVTVDKKEEVAAELPAKPTVEIKPYRKRYKKIDPSAFTQPQKRKQKTAEQITATIAKVEERLASFGIKGQIIKAHQGVTLTMFEFQPSAGVKISKIQALGDDLALVLGAPSIRILAPIPGQSTVGFEVPSEESNMLHFSELMPEMVKKKSMELPIVLGMDVYNQTHVADLSKMPHVLVSGTTGSGKSVFMNNVITGLIAQISPKHLRFLMIDPKMIELSPYNGIPHLLKPVVTDVDEAKDLLLWAESEMDKRYQIFSEMQAKSINTFNSAVKKSSKRAVEGRLGRKIDWAFEEMPYIVIVIDELADLMLTQGKEVERPITRIAQKARAAGIHMIVATQRPSSDIVTGLIKTNFPTRVSFKVSSGIDSRTILDASGAEKLLGNGDMLFMTQGKNIERMQGSFISEDEVKKAVQLVTAQQ